MFLIKNGQLIMYDISKPYKDYLRKFDNKVSIKDTRKFYGIIVTQNNIDYCIPFTSKINKKTSSKLTVNIKDNGYIIAKLLLNNMIPVNSNDCIMVDINKEKYKNYFLKEIQYLRKPNIIAEILRKTEDIYNVIKDPMHKDFSFFSKICCNFHLLEEKCKEWEEVHNILPTLNYIKNENDLFYIYDNLSNRDNFDRIVKMLDNDIFVKNIISLNIKDLENKRLPSVQEIITSVYEKIKDKKEVNFDDLLNDLETFLDLSGKFQDVFNDGKFIKPLSKQEIEDIKVRAFEDFKNLYGDEELDVQEENIDTPNLEDNYNNSNPPKEAEVEEIPKYEDTIYENKNAKVNEAGDVILETPPQIEIQQENLENNINILLDNIDNDLYSINWKLFKNTLRKEIESVLNYNINQFITENEKKQDKYLKIIPDTYKDENLDNTQILYDFLCDKITNKFGTIEEIANKNKQKEEGEEM